jgi:hypothetical protein
MGGGNSGALPIAHQHWQAIRSHYHTGRTSLIGITGISYRCAIGIGPIDDLSTMDLLQPQWLLG